MTTGHISIGSMFRVFFRREFYLNMTILFLVCVPAVLVALYLMIIIDRKLGFSPFIDGPYHLIFFVVLSVSGYLIVWWAYTYLVFAGEGSPSPQLGETKNLVTNGPYGFIRHPSVVGKLFGIIGLGCLSRSLTFTFILIPLLFVWSVYYNRFIQEKGCEKRFGDEYRHYRRSVPMFVPRSFRPYSKIKPNL